MDRFVERETAAYSKQRGEMITFLMSRKTNPKLIEHLAELKCMIADHESDSHMMITLHNFFLNGWFSQNLNYAGFSIQDSHKELFNVFKMYCDQAPLMRCLIDANENKYIMPLYLFNENLEANIRLSRAFTVNISIANTSHDWTVEYLREVIINSLAKNIGSGSSTASLLENSHELEHYKGLKTADTLEGRDPNECILIARCTKGVGEVEKTRDNRQQQEEELSPLYCMLEIKAHEEPTNDGRTWFSVLIGRRNNATLYMPDVLHDVEQLFKTLPMAASLERRPIHQLLEHHLCMQSIVRGVGLELLASKETDEMNKSEVAEIQSVMRKSEFTRGLQKQYFDQLLNTLSTNARAIAEQNNESTEFIEGLKDERIDKIDFIANYIYEKSGTVYPVVIQELFAKAAGMGDTDAFQARYDQINQAEDTTWFNRISAIINHIVNNTEMPEDFTLEQPGSVILSMKMT